MTHNEQSKGYVHANKFHSETKKKDTADIATYKKADENHQATAFNQVMSQMNIAGRNTFDKQYAQLWNEASEENKSLSVIACDIDYFEEYLNHYTQQGACFMLLVIALALKTICEEKGYFLAHYKKAEFSILLKGKDEAESLEIAESLRQAVEDSQTEHNYSKIGGIITLSVGISRTYPSSMQMLMQKTNNALLNAKKEGRNQAYGDFYTTDEDLIIETEPEAMIEAPIAEKESVLPSEEELSTEKNDMFTLETDGLFTPEGDANFTINEDDSLTFEADDFLTFETDEEPATKRKNIFALDTDGLFTPQ